MTRMEITNLLAALVRDGRVAPGTWTGLDADVFCQVAERHGVAPLVTARAATALEDAPAALRASLRDLAQRELAVDLAREAELRRVLAGLDTAGVGALLMKGAQLAYTHYPRPDLRPRLDTDVVIPAARRRAVHEALVELGYESEPKVGADLVMHQRPYFRPHDGIGHVVDVHWRPLNPEVFREMLSYDEMAAAAGAVPGLGPAARGLSDLHALLLACVHRVAHHFDEERLIWLYDVHLIASGLGHRDWEHFIDLATDRRVAAVCCASLRRAVDRFGTTVPDAVWEDEGRYTEGRREVSAAYLRRNRPHVRAVVDDLRALQTWADRWRMMREHLIPPAEYMRGVYAPSSTSPLVWLYTRRLFAGARKWLVRP